MELNNTGRIAMPDSRKSQLVISYLVLPWAHLTDPFPSFCSTPYDWYQTYGSLSPYLTEAVLNVPLGAFPNRATCRVLNVGCGTSQLLDNMRIDGWTGDFVNVDYSSNLIDTLQKQHDASFGNKNRKTEYICADVTKPLTMLQPESFDLIIVKGTLDAVLSSAASGHAAKRMIENLHALLKPGHGVLFVVSHAGVDQRSEYFEKDGDISYYWSQVMTKTLPSRKATSSNSKDYVYICRKHENLNHGLYDAYRSNHTQSPLRIKSVVTKDESDDNNYHASG